MSPQDIEDYERAVEELANLLARGKLSSESYMKAKRELEKELNKLKTTQLDEKSVCPRCGREISSSLLACPDCGKMLVEKLTPASGSSRRYSPHMKPTSLWYLVPLLFGLLGGVVGYVGVKDEDREMGSNLLWVGIGMTIVWFFVIWATYTNMFQ